MELPALPLPQAVDALIHWLQHNLDPVFGPAKTLTVFLDDVIRGWIRLVPPWLLVAVVSVLLAWRRSFVAGAIVGAALLLILNQGYWRAAIDTSSLAMVSTAISLCLGVPLGMVMAESRLARALATPVLDYMQSTPAFVYLIPSVLFLGVGTAPGVFATVMFALPPVARTLLLGLDLTPASNIEAAQAFGASRIQILFKVKLPAALPYLGAGINQSVMMALSMVVVCSLIGARGLGVDVITALSQMNLRLGIESGVSVVLLAIVFDHVFSPNQRGERGKR